METKEFRYRCMHCKKLFSCETDWRKHTEWMLSCGKKCICDVFSFSKYSYSLNGTSAAKFQRNIEQKELKKLENLIQTTMEKPELIEAEKFKSMLETKRDVQREESILFSNKNREQLMEVEGWLATLSQQCEINNLKAVGAPICDAIVYPRCPLLFGYDINKHDHELMLFLKSHNIAVRSVSNTAKADQTLAFVYLLDSDNEYNIDLMEKLQRSLDDIASKIIEIIPTSKIQKSIIQTELANLYIRQTDYAKDYLSFLIVKSLDKKFDVLRRIGDKIGMSFSQTHSQLFTSIQFQSFAEDVYGKQVRVQRLKAYNKWVHLLLTTSFKAALSMGTSKLFKGPAAFHMNKLQPSFNDGLLRIELSSYYYSVEQWKREALQIQQWNMTIANMEHALREVEEQLVYKVSFKVFWDSFWFSVDAATVIIDFQADLWTIVYAYSSRSYLYTGHHTDKHTKSGAQLTFLQRFAGAKTLVRVKNGEQAKQFLIYRHGSFRQIPIGSLNVKQVEENRMPIDMHTWFYHLSEEQLNQTYFTCNNQEEFDEQFGQDPDINYIDKHIYGNDGQQLPWFDAFQEDNNIKQQINTNQSKIQGEVKQNKRVIKQSGKVEVKDKKISRSVNKTKQDDEQWKKKGFHKGKQRWQCSFCNSMTNNKDAHKCII